MAKKKTTKGKRYTAEEKQEVLDFVASVDSEKGRGGVAAAQRKFGITALTITNWKKKSEGTGSTSSVSSAKGKKGTASRGTTAQSRVLHRLGEILDTVAQKEAEIADLKNQYAKLKKKV